MAPAWTLAFLGGFLRPAGAEAKAAILRRRRREERERKAQEAKQRAHAEWLAAVERWKAAKAEADAEREAHNERLRASAQKHDRAIGAALAREPEANPYGEADNEG